MLPYNTIILQNSFTGCLYGCAARCPTAARVLSLPFGIVMGVSQVLFAVAAIVECLAFIVINAFGAMFGAKSCSCKNIYQAYQIIKGALSGGILYLPLNIMEVTFETLLQPQKFGENARQFTNIANETRDQLKRGQLMYEIEPIVFIE